MAETLKSDQVETFTLTKEAVRSGIGEINGAKEKASEHNGAAAKATKDFADKYGLDKGALTTVAKLTRKETATQMTFWRDALRLARDMGHFSTIGDAFDDDPIEVMRRIVADADAAETVKAENRVAREAGKPDLQPVN